MSFFRGSSHLAISGGNFTVHNGLAKEEIDNSGRQSAGQTRYCSGMDLDETNRDCGADLSDLMMVKRSDLDLRSEVLQGSDFRIHSAAYGPQGRVVAVKVFEGPRAKLNWTADVAFFSKIFHPNLLRVLGISSRNLEMPFILFQGLSEQKMQPLIAEALRADLNQSIWLAMKAVKGIASGLSYIKSQKLPLRSGTQDKFSQIGQNFDILAGNNDEPIIAIYALDTSDAVRSSGPLLGGIDNSSGLEVLDELCQKLFSETNSILYDDSPIRELDYNADEGPEVGKDEEEVLGVRENDGPVPRNALTASQPSRSPRREVWWRRFSGSLDHSSQHLEAIAQLFANRLAYLSSTTITSPLRRIRVARAVHSRRSLHCCPGYLREEITLTPDITKSAIITHDYPSESEICLGCGQLVRFEPDDIDNDIVMTDVRGSEPRPQSNDQATNQSLPAQVYPPQSSRTQDDAQQTFFPASPHLPVPLESTPSDSGYKVDVQGKNFLSVSERDVLAMKNMLIDSGFRENEIVIISDSNTKQPLPYASPPYRIPTHSSPGHISGLEAHPWRNVFTESGSGEDVNSNIQPGLIPSNIGMTMPQPYMKQPDELITLPADMAAFKDDDRSSSDLQSLRRRSSMSFAAVNGDLGPAPLRSPHGLYITRRAPISTMSAEPTLDAHDLKKQEEGKAKEARHEAELAASKRNQEQARAAMLKRKEVLQARAGEVPEWPQGPYWNEPVHRNQVADWAPSGKSAANNEPVRGDRDRWGERAEPAERAKARQQEFDDDDHSMPSLTMSPSLSLQFPPDGDFRDFIDDSELSITLAPSLYGHQPSSLYANLQSSGHTINSPRTTTSFINSIFQVPPLPPSTKSDENDNSLAMDVLPPFSALEAVADGEAFAPLSPIAFRAPEDN